MTIYATGTQRGYYFLVSLFNNLPNRQCGMRALYKVRATAPTAMSNDPAQPALPIIVVARFAPLVPLPEDCVEELLLADNAPLLLLLLAAPVLLPLPSPPPALVVLPLAMLLGLPELLVGVEEEEEAVLPVELLLVLTELPPDDEDPLLLLLEAGSSVSLGVTTFAAPLKSHAVLAFFWLV